MTDSPPDPSRLPEGFDPRLPPASPAVAEAALAQTLERLRAAIAERDLNQQMALRFESEIETLRRDLSGALQRDLGEHLAGLRALAETLVRRLDAREPSLAQLAELMLSSTDAMSATIRSLASRIRPDALNGGPFPEALRALASDWRLRRPQARIELMFEPADDAVFGLGTPDAESLALAIVATAIDAALLEAGAALVVVSLARQDAELRLLINDDGRLHRTGRRPHAARLASLCDRAALRGGQWSIEPGESGGTEVLVSLPWRDG
ncbi:MAG: hypothetical protein ABT05_00580 [Lautropia sp. SCN 66-9]|nr:MAG: hypothetical protein ABT05_00580 [Lautropia sp. SCN 66-9]